MSKIEITGIDKAFKQSLDKSEKAVKNTLVAFYPSAGHDIRKTKKVSVGKESKSGKRSYTKTSEGVPYKVTKDSLADPGGSKARVGFYIKETTHGVLYKPKKMSKYNWVKTMEEGGSGIPGEAAVRLVAIMIGDKFVSKNRKRKHNK